MYKFYFQIWDLMILSTLNFYNLNIEQFNFEHMSNVWKSQFFAMRLFFLLKIRIFDFRVALPSPMIIHQSSIHIRTGANSCPGLRDAVQFRSVVVSVTRVIRVLLDVGWIFIAGRQANATWKFYFTWLRAWLSMDFFVFDLIDSYWIYVFSWSNF